LQWMDLEYKSAPRTEFNAVLRYKQRELNVTRAGPTPKPEP